MSWSAADHAFMARALRLARRGMYTTSPNPRVGCVLVRDGHIAGEGWHERAGGPHAEVAALNAAGTAARGADCYVTLEPCSHHGRTPPCAQALIEAGVARVVAALQDPNPRVSGRGLGALAQAGIETSCGLLCDEAAELNRGFVKRMTSGRPFMRVKLAFSADGFTAVHSGVKWITGEAARADVQRLRAESCAVLTGIGTVLADDPRLNVRREGFGARQPLRVVLDRALRFPAGAAMLALPGRTIVLTCSAEAARQEALRAAGAEVVALAAAERDWLDAVLHYLAEQEQVNEVLVEAGATLAGALIAADAADELVAYQSRESLGSRGRAPLALPETESSDGNLRLVDRRAVGADWRLTYRRPADTH